VVVVVFVIIIILVAAIVAKRRKKKKIQTAERPSTPSNNLLGVTTVVTPSEGVFADETDKNVGSATRFSEFVKGGEDEPIDSGSGGDQGKELVRHAGYVSSIDDPEGVTGVEKIADLILTKEVEEIEQRKKKKHMHKKRERKRKKEKNKNSQLFFMMGDNWDFVNVNENNEEKGIHDCGPQESWDKVSDEKIEKDRKDRKMTKEHKHKHRNKRKGGREKNEDNGEEKREEIMAEGEINRVFDGITSEYGIVEKNKKHKHRNRNCNADTPMVILNDGDISSVTFNAFGLEDLDI
jgi:hypothetical protein